MNIVNEFNGLNACAVSREKISEMIAKANSQEQFHVARRLQAILDNHADSEFNIEIDDPAIEAFPESLLECLECHDFQDESFGLGKVSADDIYDYITNLIINTINHVGHLPWQKSWTGSGADGEAKNYVSKKPYTGVNCLLNFDIKFDEKGEPYLVPIQFKQPYYLTFNQIRDAKASLREGSKGRRVTYYTMIFDYKSDRLNFKTSDREKLAEFVAIHGLTKSDLAANLSRIPVIKYYNVFRADDCTGLTFPAPKEAKKVSPIEICQQFIDGYPNPPKFTFVGDRAYYQPASDTVNMPKIEAFDKETAYYCTFFHELSHSTGAEKRLKRDFSGRMKGSVEQKKKYAFEELIAELGAVFLCSESGILFHTKENSAKYLKHWNERLISELENDNRFFLKASAAAQKAVNHILDRDPNAEKTEPKTQTQAKEKKEKVSRVKPKATVVAKVIGFALVDNISGEIIASKASLAELEKFYNENAHDKFSDMPAIVYEIVKNGTKNKLGKKLDVEFSKKPTATKKEKNKSEFSQTAKKRNQGKQLKLALAKPALKMPEVNSDPLQPKSTVVPEEILPRPTQTKITVGSGSKTLSNNSKVHKIGEANSEKSEYFTVNGEVGKFLQQVEKKPVHSVVVTLDGEQGAGKTTTLYKFMDAFATPGNSCLFISGEEHPQSSLAIDKAKKHLSDKAKENIDTIADVASVDELYKLIAPYDIIFIDSWQKLLRMVGTIRLDEDLRQRFNGKVFVIIFQQTTTGRTKGGAEVVFDGDIIIKMVKAASFADNYAFFDKNRYTLIPIETIRYNIANGKTYNPEATTEPLAEVKSVPAKLSFEVHEY